MLVPLRSPSGTPFVDAGLVRLLIAAMLAGALLFVIGTLSDAGSALPENPGGIATEVRQDRVPWRRFEPAIAGGESRAAAEV
jgi:hypothetical protein